MPHKFERLPSNVVPLHYDLTLKPDLVKCKFEGQVSINLEVKEPTQRVVLNSLDLELGHIELQLEDGSLFLPSQVLQAVECETVAIVFASSVPVGHCKLSISFKGTLTDNLKGLYVSKYTSHDGKEERYSAVTQFESCHAHRCFPCWDEPALKATFDINLNVPKDRVALSNMPVKNEEDLPDGNRLVRFTRTPIMSTYLVAVVVGEFDYVEDVSSDGVLVRVYTPLGKKEQGQFALEVTVKALPYYKDYFEIAYPLPKMDLIAVKNFAAGAMENWGLVLYREQCLLVDSKNTSTQRKQWIALTVTHELAHQWFGNLVTMEWWTHLWLNEGYATFAEFLCTAHIFPEYDIWTQFVTDTHNSALKLDALKNSHPIEVPVGHPAEVDEIFDDISYFKGASVIRMLHNYLGDADFRKGMGLYLKRHQYRNAFTEDLWAALEEASKKPVSTVMPTWTRQMGFPVISVNSEQVSNDRKLKIGQTKFCADGSVSEETESQMWMVPIEFSSSKAPGKVIHSLVLENKEAEVTLSQVSEEEWVKLNPGTVGFYRVQYSPEMLEKFIPSISNLSLPPLDRLGLLDDLFALVQAGLASTDQVLRFLQSMDSEDNYTVWFCISSVLNKLMMLLEYADDVLPHYMAFGRRILERAGRSVSWDPLPEENHKDKLFRSVMLDLLLSFEDEATIAECQKRFAAHLNGTTSLLPDIRTTVYRAVLKNADAATYETFLKMYREESLAEEKRRIAHSFMAMKDENLLKKVLDFAISDEVLTSDSLGVLGAVAQTRKGRDLVWQMTREKWDHFQAKYSGIFLVPNFIKCALAHFVTVEKADEVENFFSETSVVGAERAVQQAVEKIRLNAAWLKRDLPCIQAFLQEYK